MLRFPRTVMNRVKLLRKLKPRFMFVCFVVCEFFSTMSRVKSKRADFDARCYTLHACSTH